MVLSISTRVRERSAGNDGGLLRLLAPGMLIALLISEWDILLTHPFSTGMGQDFTTLYVAARVWLQGLNPYTSQVPVQLAAALHVRYQGELEQPLLLPLVAPLTSLSPHVAYIVYALVQATIVGGALLLWAGLNRRHPGLLVAACVASPSAFLVNYYGQAGALVFGIASLGWWARCRRHATLLGVCIAASLIKPQLGLCMALPLLWGAPRRAWLGALAGGVVFLAATVVVMTPPGFAAYLRVLHAFMGGVEYRRSAVDGLGASALYRGWLGAPSLVAALACVSIVAVGSVILAIVARHRARPTLSSVALLVPLLVLLLPYSHQYDSIALLPALVITGQKAVRERRTRLLFWCAVALITVTPLMALNAHPFPFRLLPFGLIVWIVCGVIVESRMYRLTAVQPPHFHPPVSVIQCSTES